MSPLTNKLSLYMYIHGNINECLHIITNCYNLTFMLQLHTCQIVTLSLCMRPTKTLKKTKKIKQKGS